LIDLSNKIISTEQKKSEDIIKKMTEEITKEMTEDITL